MRIRRNIPAANSHRIMVNSENELSKSLEKLSSGYQINRAGDNAAGLAISEKMRAQISELNQVERNARDGISLVQTAEGALAEVHSMLNRMKELSALSANGILEDEQRAMYDKEMQELKDEIDRIGKSTNFNGIELFSPDDSASLNLKSALDTRRLEIYSCTLDLKNKTAEFYTSGESRVLSSGSSYDALAEKIATEYFPNAITQIFNTFSSLQNAVGSDKVSMELCLEYIDGPDGTLAYAQYACYESGKPVNMLIKVDTSDFSDETIKSGNADIQKLESTIAHELMHSVMQYTLTDGLSGRTGNKYPTWFIEGTAQLAGGGFTTGWNDQLSYLVNVISNADDRSLDTEIARYLKSFGVEERPYGHGYLASAYIGYLAAGGTGPVTGAAIARGMDLIFTDLLNGDSFDAVLSKHTGGLINGTSSLEALFDNASSDLVTFVRKLSYESSGGAGSIIAADLSAGGESIIGESLLPDAAFFVHKINTDSDNNNNNSTKSHDNSIRLQIGMNYALEVQRFRLDSTGLGLDNTSVKSQDKAVQALGDIDKAINQVSMMRSYYGATMNRLEHTIANLNNSVENLTAAESAIRDTDMAVAIAEYTRNQILQQAGQAMLAQANQIPDSVLTLLNT